MYIFNREEEIRRKKTFKVQPHKQEIALQTVEMIDANGEIKQEKKEVIIDETEMISSIPAYTTKIEFMKQYGTLDKGNIVKYKFAPTMSENDIMKLRNDIISSNIKEEKKNDVVDDPKNE